MDKCIYHQAQGLEFDPFDSPGGRLKPIPSEMSTNFHIHVMAHVCTHTDTHK